MIEVECFLEKRTFFRTLEMQIRVGGILASNHREKNHRLSRESTRQLSLAATLEVHRNTHTISWAVLTSKSEPLMGSYSILCTQLSLWIKPRRHGNQAEPICNSAWMNDKTISLLSIPMKATAEVTIDRSLILCWNYFAFQLSRWQLIGLEKNFETRQPFNDYS